MRSRPIPIVGQTLYDLNVGNAARRRPQTLTPVTVVSVGRKYFKCVIAGNETSRWAQTEYHLDDWTEHTDHCVDHCLYATKEEWTNQAQCQLVLESIEKEVRGYGQNKLRTRTLEQLERILAILNEVP